MVSCLLSGPQVREGELLTGADSVGDVHRRAVEGSAARVACAIFLSGTPESFDDVKGLRDILCEGVGAELLPLMWAVS